MLEIAERLGDDVGRAHARVERRVRVLEDDLQLAPDRAASRAAPSASMRWPRQPISPGGRLDQLQDRLGRSVDLPQPLSPTRPSVSPSAMRKLTPSTARTWPLTRAKTPLRTGKCFGEARAPRAAGRRRVALMRRLLAARDRPPSRRPQWPARLRLAAAAPRAAALDGIGAARREGAAGDRLAQRRHHARDLGEPRARGAALARQPRHRAAAGPRV